MPKRYVDRQNILQGINTTTRDSRVPFSLPRNMENFSLPDGRARRRAGFGPYADVVSTTALTKATGTAFYKKLPIDGSSSSANSDWSVPRQLLTSPLSYGLIKWQDDYQLKTASDKTIEFMLRLGDEEELVTNHQERKDLNVSGHVLRSAGVYIWDQTILANSFDRYSGFIASDDDSGKGSKIAQDPSAGTPSLPTPLTTLAIKYLKTSAGKVKFIVEFTLYETANDAYCKASDLTFTTTENYVSGNQYHIAIVQDARVLKLYVNATEQGSFTVPSGWVFVGEKDKYNGITYSSGQKRDIVILNEATVRASYSSTCRSGVNSQNAHSLFTPDYINDPEKFQPWCFSPPAGTAIWDIRIWDEDASSKFTGSDSIVGRRLYSGDSQLTNCKGNWFCNDGGPVIINHTGDSGRYLTIHHGNPGYVTEPEMISSQGMKFAEGQHAILKTNHLDGLIGRAIQDKLSTIFQFNSSLTGAAGTKEENHRPEHDFTVMMQVKITDGLQPELNEVFDASTSRVGSDNGSGSSSEESRVSAGILGSGGSSYILLDGRAETNSPSKTRRVLKGVDNTQTSTSTTFARAFDQTLWSVEANQNNLECMGNDYLRRRIPLARGLINPAGQVIFEVYKQLANTDTDATLIRVAVPVADKLDPGKTYAITFIQRTKEDWDSTDLRVESGDWELVIRITDLAAGTTSTTSHTITDAAKTTFSVDHLANYNISIGASYVDDTFENYLNGFTSASTPFTCNLVTGGRTTNGPFPTTQRFMSPYQDQPGNFVCGMFRFWSLALTNELTDTYNNSKIASNDLTPELLFNLEFDEPCGDVVKNYSRYNEVFNTGFKGWGVPTSFLGLSKFYVGSSLVSIPLPVDPSGWSLEDCLGYSAINNAGSPQSYTTRGNNVEVLGLLPCKSNINAQFGVCSNYDGALSIDETLKGNFRNLNIVGRGLLNEFSPNNHWFGSLTDKKLILTSLGGRPKAFDGTTCTLAGFKTWSGGVPLAYFDKSETTCAAGFYGIRVVYRSNKHGIYDFSPVTTVQIPTGETGELLVADIPPHPDPRVSGIEVYRTVLQTTEDLAINGPLFLCETIKGNGFIGTLKLSKNDASLLPVILDTNITPLPHCEFSAILNGKLYMTGDVLDPNKFFWSDPDNPERFDTVVNFDVVREDSGDIPTGLISAFGALILMKPNAIWRIDDLGNNRHRQTKLATVGPVTSKSAQLVVEPDTGRELIVFWAEQGPYIFDGRSARYIGGPIEEPTVGQDRANEFHWLDSSSVVVAHNSQSRELMFYCKEIKYVGGVATPTDRAALTLVYNYRFRSWYKYTGMIGTCAVSLSFSEDNNVQTPPSAAGKIPTISRGFKHLLLIGGDNGSIYKYTSAITDGVPVDASNGAAFDNKGIYTISAIDSDKYTLKDSTGTVLAADPAKFDFAGVWLYFVNSNGDFVAAPIKTNHQGVSGIVEIESSWKSFWAFTPALNDSVYIGLPPAYIEFPWDEAERPFYDKDFKKLITWHNGAFKFKEAIAYDETTFPTSWKDLADNDSQRKQTVVNRASDVLKFKIYSFDQQATFDGHAFEIEDRQAGNTAQ